MRRGGTAWFLAAWRVHRSTDLYFTDAVRLRCAAKAKTKFKHRFTICCSEKKRERCCFYIPSFRRSREHVSLKYYKINFSFESWRLGFSVNPSKMMLVSQSFRRLLRLFFKKAFCKSITLEYLVFFGSIIYSRQLIYWYVQGVKKDLSRKPKRGFLLITLKNFSIQQHIRVLSSLNKCWTFHTN